MNYRIGEGTKFLMIGFVATIDFIEFILTIFAIEIALETITAIIEYGILWAWFKIYGVDYFSTKRLTRQGVVGIIEAVPVLGGLLPLLTYTVWKTIKESREEDRQKQENEENIQNENIIRQKIQVARSENPNIIRPKKS